MDLTLFKGLQVLQSLASSDGSRGVAELARELSLTKSGAHRLLQTLVACGYASSNSKRKYSATLKLWELGSQVTSRLDVKAAAVNHLRALAEATGESVHLSMLSGDDVVDIEKIESSRPPARQTGTRVPVHCNATGKAMLAFQSGNVVERLGPFLRQFTARTIVDPDSLRQELMRVRQRGFAIDRGEWTDELCGLGAPVRDATNSVVAAVGILGPATRMKREFMLAQAPRVMATAAGITRALVMSDKLRAPSARGMAPSYQQKSENHF